MRDIQIEGKGLVNYDEPFANLLTQGMVLNHIFSRRTDKGGIEYFAPEEVELVHDEGGKIKGAKALKDGLPVDFQGMGTMSKSKRNGVDPQSLIEQYGADTARFFMMFAAPPEQTLEWSDSGVEGSHRFLKRVWGFAVENQGIGNAGILPTEIPLEFKKARREIHLVLKQANFDLEKQQFNTVASACMKILNLLERVPSSRVVVGQPIHSGERLVIQEGFSILLRLLSPIAPHITQALWKEVGYGDDILKAAWPEALESAMAQDEVELMIQVNGKLRGSLLIDIATPKEDIEKKVVDLECVTKFLVDGASVRKIIVVPNKLVNVVIN